MSKKEVILEKESKPDAAEGKCCCTEKTKKKWEKPVLEDVSGKVMAQPYIRFT